MLLALSRIVLFVSFALAPAVYASDAKAGPADGDAFQAALAESAHKVRASEIGFTAFNPAQGWEIQFNKRGVDVTPEAAGWAWGLETLRYGFEGSFVELGTTAAATIDGGRTSYCWDGNLEEWYINEERGLEHGFTLAARPDRKAGLEIGSPVEPQPLEIHLRVHGGLLPVLSGAGRTIDFYQPDNTRALSYSDLTVFDADGVSLDAGFRIDPDQLTLLIDERNARYPLTIDPLAQDQFLTSSQAKDKGHFGWAVAMDGAYAVVGAIREDSSTATACGAAYIFVKGPAGWAEQARLTATQGDFFDDFGWSVAISGDTVVIGAPAEDSMATGVNGNEADDSVSYAGAAYVFVRSGTTWTQQAYLKPTDTSSGAGYEAIQFGTTVAMLGDVICVGAVGESSNATGVNGNAADNSSAESGAAYVFRRTGTTWVSEAYLKASNTDPLDFFGSGIAVGVDTVFVGAKFEQSKATGIGGDETDNSATGGAVYIFERLAGVWSQQVYMKASDKGGRFGSALAVDGDTLVVGSLSASPGDASAAGAAYVFVKDASAWSQQGYLFASEKDPWWGASYGQYLANFGTSVAIDQDRILVGAPGSHLGMYGVNGYGWGFHTGSTDDIGAAYTFERTAGVWSQVDSLRSDDPQGSSVSSLVTGDAFGHGLALDGDSILVGSPGDRALSGGTWYSAGGTMFSFNINAPCGVFRYGPFGGSNTADLYGHYTPTPGAGFEFYLSSFPIWDTAHILISVSPSSLPLLGGALLVDPALSLTGTSLISAPAKHSKTKVSVPIPAGVAGLSFFAQAVMFTPLTVSGITLTNGLEVIVCP